MASNKPIVTFLGCQFELIKLTMNANTSTNLQRSNVVIGDNHFNNASNTYKFFVATPLWAKCEGEAHTPKSGNLESSGTPENSELELKGQNTLH